MAQYGREPNLVLTILLLCSTIKLSHQSNSSVSEDKKFCEFPNNPNNEIIRIQCNGKHTNYTLAEANVQRRFPESCSITTACVQGSFSQNNENKTESRCVKGKWQPDISKCYKICEKLFPTTNMNLTCYNEDSKEIPCNGTLLSGTIAEPACKIRYHPNSNTKYNKVLCLDEGRWNQSLINCVPDCGVPPRKVSPLISYGVKETVGGSPWMAALYRRKTDSLGLLICGATIIMEDIVITAAHCVFDFRALKLYENERFLIVIGKMTRNYNKTDTDFQKTFEIKRIYAPPSFLGSPNDYANDIAIMQLAGKIEFSDFVYPACMDWNTINLNLKDNTTGKISGWGYTENETLPEYLLTTDLEYVSYGSCYERLSRDFKSSLTWDKFCAVGANGQSTEKGDSGSGFLFFDNRDPVYYLRGIQSVNLRTERKHTLLFTDISKHIEFISGVMKEINNVTKTKDSFFNDINSDSCTIPSGIDMIDTVECSGIIKHQYEISDNYKRIPHSCIISAECENLKKRKFRLACVHGKWYPSALNCLEFRKILVLNSEISANTDTCQVPKETTLEHYWAICDNTTVGSGGNADKNCTLHMRCNRGFPAYTRSANSTVVCSNGEWQPVIPICVTCGKVHNLPQFLVYDGRKEEYGGSPWQAAIYKRDVLLLICGGTIITQKHILSAAHCFYDFNNHVKWPLNLFEIVVSKQTRNYTKSDNEFQKSYTIKDILFSDKSFDGFNTLATADIALVITDVEIEFNAAVLPACIDLSSVKFKPKDGALGKVSGWGVDNKNSPSETLQTANLPYMSYLTCKDRIDNVEIKPYVTVDKFCAGNKIGAGAGKGDSGGGLLFANNATNFLFYVRGIVSVKQAYSDSSIAIFTDVSYYTDWLRSVISETIKLEDIENAVK